MSFGSITFKIGSFWAYLHDQSQSHFSSMAFKRCTNRIHMGMFNIISGFFEIPKFKILHEFLRFSHFDRFKGFSHNWGHAYQKHEGAHIRGLTWRTGSVGGAYF